MDKCKIQNFCGAFMRNEISNVVPRKSEEWTLNLNRHDQPGSHWVCWIKIEKDHYYFDSFGERPPPEIIRYLKTKNELKTDKPTIHCNALTVEQNQSEECGALCLYIIFNMLKKEQSSANFIQKLKKRYSKCYSKRL